MLGAKKYRDSVKKNDCIPTKPSCFCMFQTLNLVNIGSLFIESSTMFLAFENYCINQVLMILASQTELTALS